MILDAEFADPKLYIKAVLVRDGEEIPIRSYRVDHLHVYVTLLDGTMIDVPLKRRD